MAVKYDRHYNLTNLQGELKDYCSFLGLTIYTSIKNTRDDLLLYINPALLIGWGGKGLGFWEPGFVGIHVRHGECGLDGHVFTGWTHHYFEFSR